MAEGGVAIINEEQEIFPKKGVLCNMEVVTKDQVGFKRLTCTVCQKPVSTKGGNKSKFLQEEKAATSNIKLL